MKRTIKFISITLLAIILLLFGVGYYMLNYALKPEGLETRSRQISNTYAYLYEDYMELYSWIDSLRTTNALRDTLIHSKRGERLHALYVRAAQPTGRTAVIVHGYTDNAVRMLPIGHLYSHHLGYNILLPDLHAHGLSEGDPGCVAMDGHGQRTLWRQHADGGARRLDGRSHHDDGQRRKVAPLREVLRGGLRLHLRVGRVQGRVEEPVRSARLPPARCGLLAVQAEVRLELPRGVSLGAGKEMHLADVLYPWRCR